jgi:hypothetical protein
LGGCERDCKKKSGESKLGEGVRGKGDRQMLEMKNMGGKLRLQMER